MNLNKFRGTGVAVVTPFRNDGSIDFKALEGLIDHLINNGVDYLVVLGTTGEAATLSFDESTAVASFIVEKTEKRVPIVLGIGGNNTQNVVNRIRNTDFNGIDGILSVSPYYNKPSQAGIYAHYKEVANATSLPVIIYNVPGRTGSCISADTTLKLAHDFSNIVATKEASGDFEQISYILRDKPAGFDVISGDDLLALPMISLGGSGVISVIANAYPAQFSTLINFALAGDFENARIIHFVMAECIKYLFTDGNPGGIKAVLDILNIAEGNLRLPLVPVCECTYNKLQEITGTIPSMEELEKKINVVEKHI